MVTLPLGKRNFSILQEPKWVSGSFWTGMENLFFAGTESLYVPAQREALTILAMLFRPLKMLLPFLDTHTYTIK
jgi:hypothetical protein